MVYPAWWDTDITIYNQYKDPNTRLIKWYKTKVQGCFWIRSDVKVNLGDTVIASSTNTCRIPENEKFMEKFKWVQLPNDEMGNYFTLGGGDIIVKGSIDDEIDEYTNGLRSTDLLAKYKTLRECLEISSVAINTGELRCMPHYYVQGS